MACEISERSESRNQCCMTQWADWKVDIHTCELVWPPRSIVVALKWSQKQSNSLQIPPNFWGSIPPGPPTHRRIVGMHAVQIWPLQTWWLRPWVQRWTVGAWTALQQERLCQACISLVPRPHPLTTKGLLSVSLVVSSQRPWFFQQVNDYDIVLVLWIASTLGWDAILLTCSELGLLTWHNQESTQWSFPRERVGSGHIGRQGQTFILHPS